jgi:hypothetical protein
MIGVVHRHGGFRLSRCLLNAGGRGGQKQVKSVTCDVVGLCFEPLSLCCLAPLHAAQFLPQPQGWDDCIHLKTWMMESLTAWSVSVH